MDLQKTSRHGQIGAALKAQNTQRTGAFMFGTFNFSERFVIRNGYNEKCCVKKNDGAFSKTLGIFILKFIALSKWGAPRKFLKLHYKIVINGYLSVGKFSIFV